MMPFSRFLPPADPNRPPRFARLRLMAGHTIGMVAFYCWIHLWVIPSQWLLSAVFLIGGLLGLRLHRRDWRHLFAGLPALCVGVGAIFLGIGFQGDADRYYRQSAQTANQNNDYAAAALCLQRLTLLHPKDLQLRYLLALATEQLGQPERSVALMRELAPVDGPSYGPAHLRLAQYLLARTDLSVEGQREAEEHLQHALGDSSIATQAHLLLGQRLLATGRAESAEPHLLKAAETWPELRLTLARFYFARNRKEEGKSQAASAADAFKQLAERDRGNSTAYIHWAEALVLVEQFPQALTVLESGPEPKSQTCRQARAQVYALWVTALDNQHSNNSELVMGLIQQGLQEDLQNAALLQRMLDFTKHNGAEGDKARRALQTLLAEGKSPTILHLMLGIDQWQQGNRAGGLQHVEQAYLASPQAPLIANNLAWMLANGDPPDLPRALEFDRICAQTRAKSAKIPQYARPHSCQARKMATSGGRFGSFAYNSP